MKGADAHAFCADEFQAFMKQFVAPVVENAVQTRYAANRDSTVIVCGKQTYCQIVDEWKEKLHDTFLAGQEFDGPDSSELKWETREGVPRSAYKPTTLPYFVSYDRGTMHSFWLDSGTKRHLRDCGVPLLQCVAMPPHGHDLHQIAEHSIGATKCHANRELGRARARDQPPSTEMCYNAVMEGSKLYTADSWLANLEKLQICLQIVAAKRETVIKVTTKTVDADNGHEYVSRKYVHGTCGGYCPRPYS